MTLKALRCESCGAPLGSTTCAYCGSRYGQPAPSSVGELHSYDCIGHYSALAMDNFAGVVDRAFNEVWDEWSALGRP